MALSYSERDGQRTAGLEVWDRSDTRLSELVDKPNALISAALPLDVFERGAARQP